MCQSFPSHTDAMASNESILYKKLSTTRYADLDSFNCPICLNMVLPPILMICDNHHIVCNSCIPHLTSKFCPVCRLPQVEQIKRSFEAERILQKLLTVSRHISGCQYTEYGCTFFLKTSSQDSDDLYIESHEQQCPYRVVKKVSDLCSWYDVVYTRLLTKSWKKKGVS